MAGDARPFFALVDCWAMRLSAGEVVETVAYFDTEMVTSAFA